MKDNFVKVPNKRILFDENDFRVLINGGIVQKDGIEVALHDIGYSRMDDIIGEVMAEPTEGYNAPGHNPIANPWELTNNTVSYNGSNIPF